MYNVCSGKKGVTDIFSDYPLLSSLVSEHTISEFNYSVKLINSLKKSLALFRETRRQQRFLSKYAKVDYSSLLL